MSTLTEQLANLYEPNWKVLKHHLDANGFTVQSPFMLGVALEYNNQGGYVDESWWTDADLKVMVFGQEPLNWPVPVLDDGSQAHSDDFVELYQRFYSDNYKDGLYFLTDSDNHLAKNKFFSMGFNGIMSGIKDFVLDESYSGKKAAYLWNNISKLSVGGRNGVSSDIHDLEKKYFHVIPQEIEILKPDVLIFLTGPGQNAYYNYIKENFTVNGLPKPLAGNDVDAVAKLDIEGISLAYKTYHPTATKDGDRGIKDAEKWQYYHAIFDDMKEHLDDIFNNK
mgnify:CR=1 FL=1